MEINKIWIFEIQDGMTGGFIFANNEEEAWKKLSLDRGTTMTRDICTIFPITALDLNHKEVFDLW